MGLHCEFWFCIAKRHALITSTYVTYGEAWSSHGYNMCSQLAKHDIFCVTRIPSGIWSRLYGWLLRMCVLRIGSFPSALNTWSKVWPWILIWDYL